MSGPRPAGPATAGGRRIAPDAAGWIAVLAVPLLAGLLWRPLIPIDETRYAAVAWEMWTRGDFLVPHLSGLPYSDKPPLLFWTILAGWKAFGVSEAWMRAVPALYSIGALLLAVRLARRLWPDEPELATLAGWLLAGTTVWALFSTLLMFDVVLAFCAVLSWTGVVEAWRGRSLVGWTIAGLGIGLGVLAKGPAILFSTLPVAALAPVWARGHPRSWVTWYFGVAGAVLLGAGIGLAWALPAAAAGGQEYGDRLLFHQTAGRVAESFSHARPWWFYLVAAPLITLPWILSPGLWGAARRAVRASRTVSGAAPAAIGERFALVALGGAVLLFSLVSGKQPQYLVPVLPAFALLAAAAFVRAGRRPTARDLVLPVVPFLVAGALLMALAASPGLRAALDLPPWTDRVTAVPGLLLGAGAIVTPLVARKVAPAACLAGLTALALAVVQAGIVPAAGGVLDVRPVADRLAEWQARGIPIAHPGKYHGQYQFYGRLAPLANIGHEEVETWIGRHPDGLVIVYFDDDVPDLAPAPTFTAPFRGDVVAVYRSQDVASLLRRGDWPPGR